MIPVFDHIAAGRMDRMMSAGEKVKSFPSRAAD